MGWTLMKKEFQGTTTAAKKNKMDKLTEMLVAAIALVGGFITKRIFKNHDVLSDRISALEKVVVTKDDLEPLERTTDMILTHILNKK